MVERTAKNAEVDYMGKIPPSNAELEELIIGTILIEPGSIYTVKKYLIPDCFFHHVYKTIYLSILEMLDKEYQIDLLTVSAYMREAGTLDEVGGSFALVNMTSRIGSGTHLDTHCRLVFDMYLKRRIIEICSESIDSIYKNIDPLEIKEAIITQLEDLFTIGIYSREYFVDTVNKTVENIFKIQELGFNPDIMTTGTVFDEIFTLQSNSIIFLASLEKHGKTKLIIFLIHLLMEKYKKEIAVCWFSMEDDADKIIKGRLSIDTGLTYDQLSGLQEGFRLTSDNLVAIEEASAKIRDDNLELIDNATSMPEISHRFRNFCKKNNDKMNILVIDNFLICTGKEKRSAKDSDNTIQDRVANFIQSLSNNCKAEGYRNIIFVLDHLKKELLDSELESGFRPRTGMVTGSSRRRQILTQLVLLNQAGLHSNLVAEEESKPPVKIAGHKYHRKDVLQYLLIAERTASRNSRAGNLVRIIADLGTMKYVPFREAYKLINPINEDQN